MTVLGHWPSAAEMLQADYPDWVIWRDVHRGRHGLWCARREDGQRQVAAETTEELRAEIRGRA